MSELVDVVDPDTGAVVDTVDRTEIRAGARWHRSVFVAVVADGAVVVHRRADWKDVWPGRWDVAFGGVVAAGEAPEPAARRELAEEAGIEGARLEPLGEGRFDDGAVRELASVYLARWDGPVRPRDGEVVAVDAVPLAELASWVASHDLVPDSVALVLPHLRVLAGRVPT